MWGHEQASWGSYFFDGTASATMRDQDSANYGRERLVEVYTNGVAGITPDIPPRYEELEKAALAAMDEKAHAYVAGSAGGEGTAARNREAFEGWRIDPKMLRGVADRDLSVELFGETYPLPFLLAPIGVQTILHENGELATARAARERGVPMVLSTVSSYTIEEVADALGETPGWFQLYWSPDRDVASSFVARAEDAGYEALMVTVDTPLVGWRERDVAHAYLPFLEAEGVANYWTDDAFRERLDAPPEDNEFAAIQEFLDVFGDASLTFEDLGWLRELTDLPIVVKGILRPDDARAAVAQGADGVVVSNHGGRQVDGAIAALEALPRVVEAIGDDATVMFDSGIRRGADAFKAMALGAEAVLFGRPYAYGLGLQGQDGVEAVMKNFAADLDLTLGLTGHTSWNEVDCDALVPASDLEP